jgi:hypothetical protein
MSTDEQSRKRCRSDSDGQHHCPNPEATTAPAFGAYCHVEYFSTDMPATSKFYADMFGWSMMPMDSIHYYPLKNVCANSRDKAASGDVVDSMSNSLSLSFSLILSLQFVPGIL